MTCKALLITVVISAFSLTACFAGEDYKCTITGSFQANKDGKDLESYNGKGFTVNKKTGVMVGSLNNQSTTQPTILDIGSEDSSYKVSNTIKNDNISSTCLLIIEESKREEQKPFVFMNGNDTFYGTCIHF